MTAPNPFDPSRYRWREVNGEPDDGYFVHHDYTILGHDAARGTLDMLVRWGSDGGHCHIHRHTATTTVLVLDGEQHLVDIEPDGTRRPERVRRAGDYALTGPESLPHLECGGPEGGLAFFGCHTDTGSLYEIIDPNGTVVFDVTIESLLADFDLNAGPA
ncbi:MAG: hypothetical protein FJW86_01175 [Actinobacteria bacterium]|nr:hypothetical protein [Actinomycetota bacterium]